MCLQPGIVQNRYLLIVACSRRKRSAPGLLPAIERYDGPLFRVLRKYRRECPDGATFLDTYIFSAKFGLISGDTPIPDYDQKMTETRAHELRAQVIPELKRILEVGCYQEAFICMGQRYRQGLDGCESSIPRGLVVKVATGGLGQQQGALHHWLHREVQTPESDREGHQKT